MKKKYLFIVMALILMVSAPMAVQAGAPASYSEPPIIAVKFHADWCGSCKAMGPLFEDLQNKFDQKNVLFVTLDFTNATVSHHSKLLSSALSLGSVVEANPGTGFILILDSDGAVLQKFTKNNTIKEISKEINANLA